MMRLFTIQYGIHGPGVGIIPWMSEVLAEDEATAGKLFAEVLPKVEGGQAESVVMIQPIKEAAIVDAWILDPENTPPGVVKSNCLY